MERLYWKLIGQKYLVYEYCTVSLNSLRHIGTYDVNGPKMQLVVISPGVRVNRTTQEVGEMNIIAKK
jgi:hypothetical protein